MDTDSLSFITMFSHFGTKFVKLYSGPMWRVETTSQDQAVPSEDKVPVKVHYIIVLLILLIRFLFD